MNMEIAEARFEGGWLMLKATPRDAIKFIHGFKAGTHELKKTRKKRSLDANGLAWALIHEIAAEIRDTPENVYRAAVQNIGGVSEVIAIKEEAVESFTRLFIGDHIGRQVRRMPSSTRGYVTLVCTYGSSDYDTHQISLLIENLKQDAHALGIQTPDDERINSLLEEWDAQTDKGNGDLQSG